MMLKRREFQTTLATLLASSLTPTIGRAAETPRYGALSLIGREVAVVRHRKQVGSNIDRNEKSSYQLEQDLFDDEALRVIQASLEKADAGKPLLYRSQDPALFDRPWSLFDDDKVVLPDDLVAAMKADGAQRLLLLTRHRQDADLHARNTSEGSGKLEGIGFYIDRTKKMHRSDTGESGRGFLAPYVYLRLSLVNLADRRLIGDQVIDGSRTISTAHNEDSFDPWDVLTPEQKVATLLAILDQHLGNAVPRVLGAA